MNLVQMRNDKDDMEAEIRASVLDFLNKYPDVDLGVYIEKRFEEMENGQMILAHVEVKANAQIII